MYQEWQRRRSIHYGLAENEVSVCEYCLQILNVQNTPEEVQVMVDTLLSRVERSMSREMEIRLLRLLRRGLKDSIGRQHPGHTADWIKRGDYLS